MFFELYDVRHFLKLKIKLLYNFLFLLNISQKNFEIFLFLSNMDIMFAVVYVAWLL